jgi:hypothetical protein
MPIPGGERIPYPVIWTVGQTESPIIPPQQGMTLAGVYLPVAATSASLALTATPDPVGKLYYNGVAFGVLPFLPVKDDTGTAISVPGTASYTVLNWQKYWSVLWFKLTGSAQAGADLKVVLIFAPII